MMPRLGEAAVANEAAAADETAAEAPDAAAATNNLKAAFSAGSSSLANLTASGAGCGDVWGVYVVCERDQSRQHRGHDRQQPQ